MNDYGTGYWGAYGVLEALRRRAVEGGSWHVKVSLGQTASWFLRLGTPHDITGVDPEYGFALADRFSEDIDSDYGRLTRLRFPIAFSGITPHWGPPVKPGTDEPALAAAQLGAAGRVAAVGGGATLSAAARRRAARWVAAIRAMIGGDTHFRFHRHAIRALVSDIEVCIRGDTMSRGDPQIQVQGLLESIRR